MQRIIRSRGKKKGKIYYLSYSRKEGYYITEGEFSREPNPYMFPIDRDVIHHIIEDICPYCPIDAAKGSDFITSHKTCDPRDYTGQCGIAELRAKCLYGRREGNDGKPI